jgi:hypothetical protein
MEIKENLKHMAELTPKLNELDNHFFLIDKLESSPSLNMELLNQAEKSWKEIENFEFQKMDVKKSFEQLIKRV